MSIKLLQYYVNRVIITAVPNLHTLLKEGVRVTNRIDYSSFTREEFLSLITLKYDPELLSRKDCENLSRIYIDFADISKEDLMNMAISRSFELVTTPKMSDNEFENALRSISIVENNVSPTKDRSKRRFNRRMARKYHLVKPDCDWVEKRISQKIKPTTKSTKKQYWQYRIKTNEKQVTANVKATFFDSRIKRTKHHENNDYYDQMNLLNE